VRCCLVCSFFTVAGVTEARSLPIIDLENCHRERSVAIVYFN
jgi:hypothetical protein